MSLPGLASTAGAQCTTSLEVARALGRPHRHVIQLVRGHCEALQAYGPVNFRIDRLETNGGGQQRYVAVLSPPQAAFILARIRSDRVSRVLADFVSSLPRQFHSEIIELIASIDIDDLQADRFIYVARERFSGRFKIGISVRPESRLRELNLGNPEPLDLVAKIPAVGDKFAHERSLHRQFGAHHLRSEWFDSGTPVHEIESNEDSA